MTRVIRLSSGACLCLLAAVAAPLAAQEGVYGGQERQFGDLWSYWPSTYVGTTLVDEGQPLIPIFEGWYPNEDGTFDYSYDYLNMNFEETFYIPIGPDNFIEPAEFNGMQPTFFMGAFPRSREGEQRHYRHQATFTVNVPADFPVDRDVVWTLRYKGKTVKVPGRRKSESYHVENLTALTSAPIAARMQLGANGPEGRGRSGPVAEETLSARVGVPVELAAHVTPMNGEDHLFFWFSHQGPAEVSFSPQQGTVPGEGGDVNTRATFSEPGEYMVRITALQTLSSMVQHCCYTNGYVKVTVTP